MQGEEGDAGTTKVLLVTEASQEFVFTEVPEKPVLSALRDFSAPVKLQVSSASLHALDKTNCMEEVQPNTGEAGNVLLKLFLCGIVLT